MKPDYFKKCETSGKIMYKTIDDCGLAILEAKERTSVVLSYYRCVYCFHYHLTSKE